MDDKHRSDTRNYAWGYFAFHADQRLKTFNFYLLLVAVVLGGSLAYLKDARTPWYVSSAGLLLAGLSFVFYKLDRRNLELIRHSQEILKAVERDIPSGEVPESLHLFAGEAVKTEELRQKHGGVSRNPATWWTSHYRYSDCLKAVFWGLGLVGIVIAIGAFFIPSAQQVGPTPMTQQFFIGGQPAEASNPKQP